MRYTSESIFKMNDYDGFSTVHEPHEYMNAPSMIIPDGNLGSAFQPGPAGGVPMIVQAAIDYTQNFVILSADELQSFYAEKASLQRQLSDINERLLVETKMHEAAQSLSKLHSEGASVHSIPTSSPKIAGSKRLSRLLGGQDPHGKSEKRLSRQAEEEVSISAGKISDLEKMQLQVELRHMQVDNIIVQHHAGVLAKELTGQTLPNHQRNRSTASTVSLSAPMSPPQPSARMSMINAAGMQTPKFSAEAHRQSWMMTSPSKPSNHHRQLSAASQNGETPYLGPGNTQQRALRSPQQHQQSQQTLVDSRRAVDAEDIDRIGLQISQLDPHQRNAYDVNASPQEKLSYISQKFQTLSGKLSQFQVENSKCMNSIRNLESELQQARNNLEATRSEHEKSKQVNRDLSVPSSASDTDAVAAASSSGTQQNNAQVPNERELLHRIEVEHSISLKWRNQFEQQRQQLLETTQALEEVTSVAVSYEGEKGSFHQLISELESKIDSLEIDKAGLLKQRLGTTANTSLLCQEFQRIVDDLVTRHETEIRALYPKFKPMNLDQSKRNLTNKDSKRQTSSNSEADDSPEGTTQKTTERSTGLPAHSTAGENLHSSESSEPTTQSQTFNSEKPLPTPSNGEYTKTAISTPSDSKDLNRPIRKPVNTQSHTLPTVNTSPTYSSNDNDEDPALPSPLNGGNADSDDDIEEPPAHGGYHKKQVSQSTIREHQPFSRSSSPPESRPRSNAQDAPSYNAAKTRGLAYQNDANSGDAFASTLNEKNDTDYSVNDGMNRSYNSADMSGNSDRSVEYHHQPGMSQSDTNENLYGLSKESLELPRRSGYYYNDSMDDSIQHTSESLMRPQIDRKNTEASEYSKASSFYGDSSANVSRSSFISHNQGDLPRPRMSNISLPTRGNIREQSFDFDDDDELL